MLDIKHSKLYIKTKDRKFKWFQIRSPLASESSMYGTKKQECGNPNIQLARYVLQDTAVATLTKIRVEIFVHKVR